MSKLIAKWKEVPWKLKFKYLDLSEVLSTCGLDAYDFEVPQKY